jgi:hypothetical protein
LGAPVVLLVALLVALASGALGLPGLAARLWVAGAGLILASLMFPAGVVFGLVALLKARRDGRKDSTAEGAVIVGFVLTLITGAVAFFGVPAARRAGRAFVCYNQVEQLVISLEMYAADHGALPPAETWCDSLDGYCPPGAFVCSAAPDLPCGYAFNAALSEVRVLGIANPGLTVTIFESDEGWNASGGKDLLPDTPRHGGKDRYGFVGGDMYREPLMVQWYGRSEVLDGTAGIFWEPTGTAEAGSHLLPNE